jgi:hypothetical protein
MTIPFQTFVDFASHQLRRDPGIAGRERVRQALEETLLHPTTIALVGDDQPQRRVLFHDPVVGFEILGHVFPGARRTQPHDHGPTWAIYGQVAGTTTMDEWDIVNEPVGETPGQVRLAWSFPLTPGRAHLYNEGVLHAPRREAAATLIRIEGPGLEAAPRRAWTVV